MADEDSAPAGGSVAKGASLVVVASILNRALSIITVPVLTRALGSSSYGLFVLARQIFWTAAPLASLGTHTGLVRFVAQGHALGDLGQVKGAVRSAAILWVSIAAVLACGGFLGADYIAAHLFHKPDLAIVLWIMAPALPVMALNGTLVSLGIGRKDMLPLALSQTAEPVTILAAFLVLRYYMPVLLAASVAWAIAQVAMLLLLLAWALRRMPLLTDRRVPAKRQLGALTKYSLPLLLTAILSFGLYQMNVMLAGVRMSAAEVGQYGVAAAFGMVYNLWLEAFRRAFMPDIAELHALGKIEHLRQRYQAVTRWGILVTLPMGVFLVAQARHVMQLCGKEFGLGATALMVVVVGQTVNAMTGPSPSMLVMSGRQWSQALNNGITMVVNVLLVWYLAPRYGAVGAAIALTAGLTTWNLLLLVEVYHAFRVLPLTLDVVRPVLILACGAPLPFLLRLASMAQLLVGAVVYYALSMATLWWVGLQRQDKRAIQSVLAPIFGGRGPA